MEKFKNKKIITASVVMLVVFLVYFYSTWFEDYQKGLIMENVITVPAGKLIEDRGDHHAVLLADGRIYIVGGTRECVTAEIYDPKTKKSKKAANLPKVLVRQEYSVTALTNGKVLIAGGRDGNDATKTAYIYNPTRNIFESTISMTAPHSEHKAVALKNGNVVITGGNRSSVIDMYNPATNKFISIGKYCSPKEINAYKFIDISRQGAVLLNNEEIFIAGGSQCTKSEDYSNQTKIIDPGSNRVYDTSSMHINRGYPNIIRLKDGRVLVASGFNMKDDFVKDIEIYDPNKNIFIDAGKTDSRSGYTLTLLQNGKVLFTGGMNGAATSIRGYGDINVYDPKTFSYKFLGNMRRKRAGHTATVLKDGSIVFIGGTRNKEIEIYKPTGKE